MIRRQFWVGAVFSLLIAAGGRPVSAADSEQARARNLSAPWLSPQGYPFGNYSRIPPIVDHAKKAGKNDLPAEAVKVDLESLDAPALAKRIIASKRLGPGVGRKTAVILDCPGHWSAALAVEFSKHAGYQPVPLIKNGNEKTLTALVELGKKVGSAQGVGSKLGNDAPPVFFLDRSRLALNEDKRENIKLPNAESLAGQGIFRVLYVYTFEGAPGGGPIAGDLREQLSEMTRSPLEGLKKGDSKRKIAIELVLLPRAPVP